MTLELLVTIAAAIFGVVALFLFGFIVMLAACRDCE